MDDQQYRPGCLYAILSAIALVIGLTILVLLTR